MRIVFFGTAEFAVPALRAVSPHVVLVVTQPDRPSGRGMKLQASPVARVAEELGLPLVKPEKARSPEFVQQVQDLRADFLLVAAYGQLLSESLLGAATRGGINLHGSILPRFRGAAPIQRCLMAGDTETGVTLMQMDRGMDTGDIIEARSLPIEPSETYGELQVRLSELAGIMAEEMAPQLAAGKYSREAQDPGKASYAPKISQEERLTNFHTTAVEAFNRFRGLTPAPGLKLVTACGPLKLLKVQTGILSGNPGTVLSTSPLEVAFSDGSLLIHLVQPEGKKPVTGVDFANGQRLKVGQSLLYEL